MARFTLPRDIYYGAGAISELKVLKGHKKAMIFTGGSSMKRGGFLQKVEDVLHDIGMETQLFEGIEPDPSIETVFRGAEAMRAFEPDVIVAIGGGSPIDAAKAMWVFYEHPEKTFEDIKDPFTIPPLRNKAIFVAIPSTSGTATEVTAFSVITDYKTDIKYPLADFEITPDIAILDTDIPLTMPKKLTAHTGMDALTHAIEAYVATARSHFSDALALQAISDIYDSIVASYYGDKEAREKMHIAQCLAGMPSLMRFWVLRIAWHIKLVQSSIFRMAAATQFCCPPSLNLMRRSAQIVMQRLRATSVCPARQTSS